MLLNYIAPCSADNSLELGTHSSSLVCSTSSSIDLSDGKCKSDCPKVLTQRDPFDYCSNFFSFLFRLIFCERLPNSLCDMWHKWMSHLWWHLSFIQQGLCASSLSRKNLFSNIHNLCRFVRLIFLFEPVVRLSSSLCYMWREWMPSLWGWISPSWCKMPCSSFKGIRIIRYFDIMFSPLIW